MFPTDDNPMSSAATVLSSTETDSNNELELAAISRSSYGCIVSVRFRR